MVLKYDIQIAEDAIIENIDRIINQIFKLLPSREEGGDWETPLHNLILEVGGMNKLLSDQTILFSLLCKMEALTVLTGEDDCMSFYSAILMSKTLLCHRK